MYLTSLMTQTYCLLARLAQISGSSPPDLIAYNNRAGASDPLSSTAEDRFDLLFPLLWE